jgi:hypothetical protein
VKARRAVDAVAIEQRQRGIAEIGRPVDERLGERRALEKAEGGRGMEFDVHRRLPINGRAAEFFLPALKHAESLPAP